MYRRSLSLIKWKPTAPVLGNPPSSIRALNTSVDLSAFTCVDLDTFARKNPMAMAEAPIASMPAYKGVNLRAHNSEDPVATTQSYPVLLKKEVSSTFVWHKLPRHQIPKGYSNNPVDLENIIDPNIIKHYGPAFETSTPILFKIENGGVQWHVLEAKGQYYMRHGRFGYVRSVPGPDAWANLGEGHLEEMREGFLYRVDGTLGV